MTDIPSSLAVSQAAFQRDVSIAAIKQQLEADRAIVRLIDQTTGSQPLNSSGRGQLVNQFA